MVHIASAKRESPFCKKPRPCSQASLLINASSASCWLSLKRLVSMSRLWFDLSPGLPEAAVGNSSGLRVYWAPADGDAKVLFVAVSLLAKFLKMSHTKVIKY